MQPQRTRRNLPRGRYAHHVNGQDPAVILEVKEKRSPRRGLQPRTVMVRGVVVADGGVPASCRDIEIVVVRVLQKVALHVHTEAVRLPRRVSVDIAGSPLKNDLAQELEFV